MLKAEQDDWTGQNYMNFWRIEGQQEGQDEIEFEMNLDWHGFTILEQFPLGDETVEPETADFAAKIACPFPVPSEPIPLQRPIHTLTRLPYQSWWPNCMKCKGQETHSEKSADRRPVIQVDYSFVEIRSVRVLRLSSLRLMFKLV